MVLDKDVTMNRNFPFNIETHLSTICTTVNCIISFFTVSIFVLYFICTYATYRTLFNFPRKECEDGNWMLL